VGSLWGGREHPFRGETRPHGLRPCGHRTPLHGRSLPPRIVLDRPEHGTVRSAT